MNSRSVKQVKKIHGKEPTTISTWAAAVVQAVESYGCPSENLLAQAGIDDKLLSDPDARIRIEDMSRLWKLAVRMTGDACVCLEASNKEEPPSDEAFDMIMAAVVAFARILSSDAVQPVRVELMRKRPSDPEAFHRFFRSPLVFRAAHNRIFFPPDGLKTPLPTANAEIARGNDQIIIDYLARFDKSRIAHQVRARLIDLLPLGEPSIDVLARSLGMSTRSLHRHLKKEQATYRDILDDIRRYLAIQYLKQPHLSIIEVAFRLGYSDSGNFSRAFKRWFGVSPMAYRRNPTF